MDSLMSYNDDEHIESRISTQVLEMAYQETLRNTDSIIKHESARRLRLRILLLENENDDLHEQLSLADDRIDGLEQEGDDVRIQLELAREESCRYDVELRNQSRELKTLKAELESMTGLNMDTTKVITEKLALSRELAVLKPELEHLRSQVAYQQTVLSEKLALQRQVSTLEVELETEKRASKCATEKNKSKERESELQQQVDDLQIDLAREKREHEKARKEAEKEIEVERRVLKRATEKGSNKERELELQKQLDDLRDDWARERKEAESVRKEIEKDLKAERRVSKRAAEKSRNNTGRDLELQRQLEELQTQLSQEKTENGKARIEADKDLNASETRKTVLESKLDQLRTKLRATKDELKECQAELTKVRTVAGKTRTSSQGTHAPAKNPLKRAAWEISADVAIGTPDGVAVRGKRPVVQRGRVDQIMLGEKSMFSITPYLNRTTSIAPESPRQNQHTIPVAGEGAHDTNADVPQGEEHHEEDLAGKLSPSAQPRPKARSKPVERKAPIEKSVLSESNQAVNSKKQPQQKSRAVDTLGMVAEEDGDENEESGKAPLKTKPATVQSDVFKASKPHAKNAEAAEPKKKKRKILGGGKTIFDEEDGEATKRQTKVFLGPPGLLGKGEIAGPKGGMKPGIAAASGFGAFSPLKKDRRGIGASFLS